MAYLITFQTTHYAISGERTILAGNQSASVMPLPAAIGEGCGICLRIKSEQSRVCTALLKAEDIPYRMYRIIEIDGKNQYELIPCTEM